MVSTDKYKHYLVLTNHFLGFFLFYSFSCNNILTLFRWISSSVKLDLMLLPQKNDLPRPLRVKAGFKILRQAIDYFFLLFTFFARSAPALNLTTFFAGILILALVAGLIP